MTTELDVIDNQGKVIQYIKSMGYDEPSEIVIDYEKLMAKFPSLEFKWPEVCTAAQSYNKSLEHEETTARYPIFLSNYTKNKILISKLRNSDLNKIVNVEGIVRKVTSSKEMLVEASWKCKACNAESKTSGISPPPECALCGKKRFEIIPESCIYEDVQFITLQEYETDNGRQPKDIRCVVHGSMIDSLQAGNRVTITGYVKIDLNENSGLGELWLDVLQCERPDDEIVNLEISNEDKEAIVKLSRDRDLFRKLYESINPAIWSYDEIKLALLLQMFGGVTVEESKTNAERVRGDSHILLCGDPSLAKSQLIRSVAKIVPRCIYTSGKSTSAAGLTVSAIRDESTGQWSLDAGALVLANGSMCVIDELDKMSAEDRSALHEALESQSISVSKAGINQTLRTACPVLCAANPKMGRFVKGVSLPDQVDLPPALLSRFDLIFMMLDEPNKENDKLVADRVFNTVRTAMDGELDRPVPIELFRKYLIYSKRINPTIPKNVETHLKEKYLSVRSDMLNGNGNITVRQLHAIIRLTQASARVRLSSSCNMEDAKRATSLFEFAMKGISLSDKIDSSMFDSQVTSSVLDDMKTIVQLIYEMKNKTDTQMEQEAVSRGISKNLFESTVERLIEFRWIKPSIIQGHQTYLVNPSYKPPSSGGV